MLAQYRREHEILENRYVLIPFPVLIHLFFPYLGLLGYMYYFFHCLNRKMLGDKTAKMGISFLYDPPPGLRKGKFAYFCFFHCSLPIFCFFQHHVFICFLIRYQQPLIEYATYI